MDYWASIVILGVVLGSVYGLASLGLVFVYRTSRFFNFAHGSLGTLGALLYVDLAGKAHWPVGFASILAVLLMALLGGGLGLISARLRDVPGLIKMMGTIGLMLIVQGVAVWRWGRQRLFFPSAVPRGGGFTVFGLHIANDQLLVVLLTAALVAMLWLFLQHTGAGRDVRAVADNWVGAVLSGVDVGRIECLSWAVGTALAAVAGILIAPLVQGNTNSLNLLIIQSYAAAMIGGLVSLPLTLLGAVVIGVSQNILQAKVAFPGMAEIVAFGAVVVVLLVHPQLEAREA
jgi:branched-subunit amino acid ABC-type transport system permease component